MQNLQINTKKVPGVDLPYFLFFVAIDLTHSLLSQMLMVDSLTPTIMHHIHSLHFQISLNSQPLIGH